MEEKGLKKREIFNWYQNELKSVVGLKLNFQEKNFKNFRNTIITNLNKKISSELLTSLKEQKNPSKIADLIAGQLNISIFEKQKLLEMVDLKTRLEKIMEHINNEINVISVEKKIRGRVKNQMEKTQREYYLNEQMKAIQRELGEIDDGKDETAQLQKSIIKAKKSHFKIEMN